MTTITTQITADQVVVTIRRFDDPVAIGVHEYSRGRDISTQLMDPHLAARLLDVRLAEGFEEIDPFAVSQMDAAFYQMVKRSLAIEFHEGWASGDPETCGRIRAFVLNRQEFDRDAQHCTMGLRFRDGAGHDGGGHITCLAEVYPNGTCPRQALHHDVYIANLALQTECTPRSHVGSCVC